MRLRPLRPLDLLLAVQVLPRLGPKEVLAAAVRGRTLGGRVEEGWNGKVEGMSVSRSTTGTGRWKERLRLSWSTLGHIECELKVRTRGGRYFISICRIMYLDRRAGAHVLPSMKHFFSRLPLNRTRIKR